MAAQVIHFGRDDCYRVPVLRTAGIVVRESRSLDELKSDLERDEHLDAVIFSDESNPDIETVADVARQYTKAPVILFRRSHREIDESKFDRVYETQVPPWIWLADTTTLIAKSRSLREAAARTRADTEEVIKESKRQRERASQLCGRKKFPL